MLTQALHQESSNHSPPKMSTTPVCTGNMSQLCKVCGEPAAGFHFGAFTCEGCKSFFGRTYNNHSFLNECKNSGRCVINKKTRTSCKSCRLRKCMMVGMSKSGSRYGRRSNWFKIHYLMQGTNNPNTTSANEENTDATTTVASTTTSPVLISPMADSKNILSPDFKLGVDYKPEYKHNLDYKASLQDYKSLNSPTPSSSESHNSDSSLELSDKTLFPPYPDNVYTKELLALYNFPTLTPRLPPYITQTTLTQRYLYPYYPTLLNMYSRKQYLDSLLQEARQTDTSTIDAEESAESPEVPSPSRDLPPPPKIFKPTVDPPFEVKSPFDVKSNICLPPPDAIPSRVTQALRGSLVLREVNPGHDLTPRGSPELVPVGVTAPQDTPIDLSVKNQTPISTPSTPEGEQEESPKPTIPLEDDHDVKDVIVLKEGTEEGTKKPEQETPLDLSSSRTG
ncbi:uncharacterized protein LOC143033737 [Oratosquilla oratoria]|uniref:uncharacterized protein LOC143033737 n=1 Tax=Oratosquilla oratoria TaxID=337810 RepID=UPI003F75CAC8